MVGYLHRSSTESCQSGPKGRSVQMSSSELSSSAKYRAHGNSLNPIGCNPSGCSHSVQRRMDVLILCRKHGLLIVEGTFRESSPACADHVQMTPTVRRSSASQ